VEGAKSPYGAKVCSEAKTKTATKENNKKETGQNDQKKSTQKAKEVVSG